MYELEAVGFAGSETTARNPKSARRAWLFRSIRTLALVKGTGQEAGWQRLVFNTYPLQITMYHPLIVHVYQAPGNVFELLEGVLSEWRGQRQR